MKNFRNILLTTVVFAFALSSCNKYDDNTGEGFQNQAVEFSSLLTGTSTVANHAADDTWGNDAIGIFMKEEGETLSTSSVLAENRKYTTPGTGIFSFASQDQAIYFPDNGSKVDFIAYFPYQETIENFSYPLDVSNQTSPANIDFLYSGDAVSLNKNSTNVTLGFSHMLSNIVLNVTDQSGLGLTGLSVTFYGMKTKSSFSLANGNYTDDASSEAPITALTSVNGATATGTAIVLPVASLTGATVTFDIPDGRSYVWNIPEGQSYESKTRYTYDILLKSDGLVALNPNASISEWIDAPSETIELGEDDQNEGQGTEALPYTVSQVASRIGETGVWVKGYIVGVATSTGVGSFTGPFTVKSNILLAETANETDFTNCISVELEDDSDIQQSLNLQANADLLNKLVKVKGNLTSSIFNNPAGITAVTEQTGGNTSGDGGNGEEVEFFYETFGTGDYSSSSSRLKINAFTDFDMKSPIVYSDQYANADIRSTSTMNAAVWFPSGTTGGANHSELHIEGIESGYTNMTLTYDIAAQTASTNASYIQIFCNGVLNTEQPDFTFSATNNYQTITLSIPDNTTSLTFFSDKDINTYGFRVDNIRIKGTK